MRIDETIIMSNDTLKIKRKLSALTSSLDDLETSLAALLSQSLPELVLGLDTIQQARHILGREHGCRWGGTAMADTAVWLHSRQFGTVLGSAPVQLRLDRGRAI